MKNKVLILTSLFGAALRAGPSAIARGGPGAGAGGGVCPFGNTPRSCAMMLQGAANRGETNPNRDPKLDGTGGKQDNPNRDPKLDGTGGPGKPADPAGPQNSSGPGPRK